MPSPAEAEASAARAGATAATGAAAAAAATASEDSVPGMRTAMRVPSSSTTISPTPLSSATRTSSRI